MPDVLLDVRELEFDRINLEVEDLRAQVSIPAELGGLLRLSLKALTSGSFARSSP